MRLVCASGIFCFLFSLSACSIPQAIVPSNQLQVEVHSASRAQIDSQAARNSSAMHEFLLGRLEYDSQNITAALEHLQHASELSDTPALVLNFHLAELLLRQGRLDAALSETEKALLASPDDVKTLMLRAGLLEALGRELEARPIYMRIIVLSPKSLDAYVLLSRSFAREGNYQESFAVLESLAKNSPRDPIAFYFLARAHEDRGSYAAAEKHMREAVRLDAQNSSEALELVRILMKERKFSEAKEVARDLVEREPGQELNKKLVEQLSLPARELENATTRLLEQSRSEESIAETHFKLAVINIDRKQFAEAALALELVLAFNNEDPQALYYLASLFAGSGRRREAVSELLKIKSGTELFVKARTFAAFVARQDGDFESAERAARDAWSESPDDKNILSYLVLILRDAKKYDSAEELMRRAILEDPQNDRLLFNYAVLLRDMGKQDQSQHAMEKVLEVNPDHTDALNYVAYGLVERGRDLVRAQALVQRALAARPNDGYYLDTLGWIHYQRGDYESAEVTLSRAVMATGNDAVILEHYGDTLVKLGKLDQAVDTYRSALEHGHNSEEKEQREAASRIEQKLRDVFSRNPELQVSIPRS